MTFARFLRCGLLAGLLAIAGTPVVAQQPPASADELLRLSQEAFRQIDEDRASDLWKASAPFIRTRFTQADYVTGMRQSRQLVGTVRERSWSSIVRVHQLNDTAGVPAGFYANVDFATQTWSGAVLYEKLSFRFEPDGWHSIGYNTRDKQ